MRVLLPAMLLLAATALWSQTPAATTAAPVSFDRSAMDTTADPCQNFYQYSCGGWRVSHPLPADKARYGRFDELREYGLFQLRSLLEDAAKPGPHTPLESKVGAFYTACMDETTADAKGLQPLDPWLKQVAAISKPEQVLELGAKMQAGGLRGFFGFGHTADYHNSKMNIAEIDQGGLTLADRDYYIKQDARMVDIRAHYVEHIRKMLVLAGESDAQATKDAQSILVLETKLAEASMDRTMRRDPKNTDHKLTAAELAALAPAINFPQFFKLEGAPKVAALNVGNPDFFRKLNELLTTVPLADWKTYLRWRVIKGSATLLSKPFVDENFEFSGRFLSGQKQMEARWKRCTALTDRSLGEALGPLYVAKFFPKESKERMDVMVAGVERAMGKDIDQLEWMSPETKTAAHAKLAKVSNKIGYPAKWKDYSKVEIHADDLIGNARAAGVFEHKRSMAKIGKPVDPSEWGMSPPTVNAYYNPSENNINFPAGILQPPFFSALVDDAVNYGAIGVVIGHELTHGFDDEGRKFDGDGNLTDWWSAKDNTEFEHRAQCTDDQYSGFVPVKDERGEAHVKGRLTLGENTADNGGMKLAYMALEEKLGDKMNQPADGFTPAQRFYIGFAQVWCENVTPQRARELVLTDPHSPGQFRVIGTVQNSGGFQKAFGCKSGDPMVPVNACKVW
jgi:predicted metalloendopeptidase